MSELVWVLAILETDFHVCLFVFLSMVSSRVWGRDNPNLGNVSGNCADKKERPLWQRLPPHHQIPHWSRHHSPPTRISAWNVPFGGLSLLSFNFINNPIPFFREGPGNQIGWIFGKVPRGGSFMLQILGTLNRDFWSLNWYKIVIWGFRVCFFSNCIVEKNCRKIKTRHTLKNALFQKLIRFVTLTRP